MSRTPASPFSPKVVLAMLVVGFGAFLLLLYALSAGWTGDDNKGSGHAASNGLDGYSALAHLLEKQGHQITLSRRTRALDDESLLIITPPRYSDSNALNEIITKRRYAGPTLIILPKWSALSLDQLKLDFQTDIKPGWVHLNSPGVPPWSDEVEATGPLDARIADISERPGPDWRGLDLSGTLPERDVVQSMSSGRIETLVRDSRGQALAGYLDDGGWYPVLSKAAGAALSEENQEIWPVVIVSEPDLMNNYGLADQNRAQLAVQLVETTLEDYDLPIVFDLTVNGLGRSDNLLTLAFTPPFLAATLCLILLAILIAWRGFGRFGPSIRDVPVIIPGKTQLARNGASLVERAGRLRLLGAPYAELVTARMARNLGIRLSDRTERMEAISRALAARDLSELEFARHVETLKKARKPHDLLRAAHALKRIERMCHP
ncbi:DUF4350 domain-containing protein [Altericroceibacterium spongiae]|uniref:DUF4350 domain-containing protein n=1 Tax=Altericroceibacterium spongiae TaxID=2320269 RepID=A0A420EBW1_9SPHN|nr:DUF4350 domain-containing protein [Altericroceibacterium spongiae]RKF18179.1 DUF4350 domain-containing protein [Altericroceibacterium spongiae]